MNKQAERGPSSPGHCVSPAKQRGPDRGASRTRRHAGAGEVIDPGTDDPVESIKDLTDGDGANIGLFDEMSVRRGEVRPGSARIGMGRPCALQPQRIVVPTIDRSPSSSRLYTSGNSCQANSCVSIGAIGSRRRAMRSIVNPNERRFDQRAWSEGKA